MLHPDIEKAIQLIDQKIGDLTKAKSTLLKAFGDKSENDTPNKHGIRYVRIRKRKSKGSSRKGAIIKLLQTEGPLSRSDIFMKTGFPKGTIAYCLNDKEIFSLKDNLWHLAEKNEEDKEMASRSDISL